MLEGLPNIVYTPEILSRAPYPTINIVRHSGIYHIAGKFGGGKFGEFGESSMIHQTKTIQLSTYN